MYWLTVILILPYLILLIIIYRSLLKIKPYKATFLPSSFVTVVVACRNEERNLPSLLKNIERQDYPEGLFEVIIVDDNSTDKTHETASDYTGQLNIITINNKGTGKKQAIRTAIEASSGNLVITTDADCRMGKRWISTIASYYEANKPDLIICPVQIAPRKGFFGRFQELEFLSLQGITAGCTLAGNPTMCNGANLAFTREAYLNHSGYLHDEIASGDDIYLLHSIKKDKNPRVSWLESADSVVTTASSPTVMAFLKQRRRWISKGKSYDDRATILLAVATFVTILLMVSLLVAAIIIPELLKVFLVVLTLKSIPDLLILRNTSARYGKSSLMKWFLPSQIVYPFYVLCVFIFSLIPAKRDINSPSPREI
ncbi:MAG TPA: glycosyltransferase [Bacteroidales bacterium]|nr:glycosyltransferase [Bacteroidales bacterium]